MLFRSAAHARWHHVVSDGLTLGFLNHVAVDGVDAETVRRRQGTLEELFSDRPATPPWFESHMRRTRDLTSRADDPFRMVPGGNLGIRKPFFRLAGGFDESFARYGVEDIEFGYRVYTRGGLLVPVRDALSWHQGIYFADERDAKNRDQRVQHEKAKHLIAHRGFRRDMPGRIYQVPQFVVTVEAGHHPVERVVETVGNVLADRVHDLVVRIETRADVDDETLARLHDAFGPDPRVRVAPARASLDEFPVSSFHVTLPADATFARNLVRRLRARLGSAVVATAILGNGSRVSIARTWALHRACRTAAGPADFGEARTLSAASLRLGSVSPAADTVRTGATDALNRATYLALLRIWVEDLRSFGDAWGLLRALAAALLWRRRVKRRATRRSFRAR